MVVQWCRIDRDLTLNKSFNFLSFFFFFSPLNLVGSFLSLLPHALFSVVSPSCLPLCLSPPLLEELCKLKV